VLLRDRLSDTSSTTIAATALHFHSDIPYEICVADAAWIWVSGIAWPAVGSRIAWAEWTSFGREHRIFIYTQIHRAPDRATL